MSVRKIKGYVIGYDKEGREVKRPYENEAEKYFVRAAMSCTEQLSGLHAVSVPKSKKK